MATKYEKMVSAQVIHLDVGDEEETLYQVMNFACCDCGMVHKLYLSRQEEDGKVAFAAVSWPRSTAQLRRHHYGNLHRDKGKWILKRKKDSEV